MPPPGLSKTVVSFFYIFRFLGLENIELGIMLSPVVRKLLRTFTHIESTCDEVCYINIAITDVTSSSF